MSKRFLTAAAAAVVVSLALVAAGCGGNGGGGEQLTAEEYAAALDKICADFNAAQEEIGEPESVEDLAELGGKIGDAADDLIAAVEDLSPPDELKDTAEKFVEGGKEQRALLGDLVDAAKDGDEAKINELAGRGEELDSESDALARELGAEECTK